MPKVDMLSFSFDEISGVGAPMNQHATADITKAADEPPPTIDAENNAAATAAVSDNVVMKGDRTMPPETEVTQKEEQVDMAGIAALLRKSTEATEALAKSVESLTAWKDQTEKVSSLSAEERQVFAGLTKETQEKFLEASSEGRQMAVAQMQKSTAEQTLGTKEVYKALDGTVYTAKDDERLVEIAKGRDQDHKMMQKVLEENGMLTMQKRAETELGQAPGKLEAKAALLKQIDGIEDETLKGEVNALLQGMNNGMGFLLKSQGTSAIPALSGIGATGEKMAEMQLMSQGLISEPSLAFNKTAEQIQLTNAGEGMSIGIAMVKAAETEAGRKLLEQHYEERGY